MDRIKDKREKIKVFKLKEEKNIQRNDFQKRLFGFGINILKFLLKLPKTPEFNIIGYQLA